jgi:EpsD family peptidyl-prolyl cis-trans isomerase
MTRPINGRRRRLRPRGWSALTAFLTVLAGCGGSGGTSSDSQVAAKVNQGEISVHQVQSVLQRQTRAAREQPEAAARRMLDSLVEQELAAQAARDEGLQNEPAVVQALQLAQREVLARAYQDRLASKAVGPTSDEIDSFYESQPALFKQRRLYVLLESAVESTPAQAQEIVSLASKASNSAEIAELLRGKGHRFETRQFVQAAEDLPFGLLLPLARLAPGQSIAVQQPGGVRIFTVIEAHLAPVDRRRATDAISAYLGTERRRQLVVEGMKTLRQGARIEYVGAFAQHQASAPASSPTLTN